MLVALAPLVGGCGSKISEANYYRVQYGMTEADVEDVLGPAHAESVAPSTPPATAPATATQPVFRKIKSWTRGPLVIRVVFEQGVVVRRSAEGIAAELPMAVPASPPPASATAT